MGNFNGGMCVKGSKNTSRLKRKANSETKAENDGSQNSEKTARLVKSSRNNNYNFNTTASNRDEAYPNNKEKKVPNTDSFFSFPDRLVEASIRSAEMQTVNILVIIPNNESTTRNIHSFDKAKHLLQSCSASHCTEDLLVVLVLPLNEEKIMKPNEKFKKYLDEIQYIKLVPRSTEQTS